MVMELDNNLNYSGLIVDHEADDGHCPYEEEEEDFVGEGEIKVSETTTNIRQEEEKGGVKPVTIPDVCDTTK